MMNHTEDRWADGRAEGYGFGRCSALCLCSPEQLHVTSRNITRPSEPVLPHQKYPSGNPGSSSRGAWAAEGSRVLQETAQRCFWRGCVLSPGYHPKRTALSAFVR